MKQTNKISSKQFNDIVVNTLEYMVFWMRAIAHSEAFVMIKILRHSTSGKAWLTFGSNSARDGDGVILSKDVRVVYPNVHLNVLSPLFQHRSGI